MEVDASATEVTTSLASHPTHKARFEAMNRSFNRDSDDNVGLNPMSEQSTLILGAGRQPDVHSDDLTQLIPNKALRGS